MSTKLNPYLGFKDNARQAMEFYKTVFGGELTLNTFQESGAAQNAAEADKIMHAALDIGDGMTLMAADTPEGMTHKPGSTISISLSGDDEAKLKDYYQKLLQGGNAIVPLDKAPWGDTFGMLVDKFGVQWLVNISSKK